MNKQVLISLHLTLILILGAITTPLSAQLTVYPGDVNNDGIVDFYDVVNFGVVFGDSGAMRPVPGIAWGPYDAPMWGDSISALALDRVYGDVDGSGMIDSVDENALFFNFGQVHNVPSITQPFSPNSPTGIPIFIDSFWYDLDTLATYQVYANIAIGSAIGPAIDVDGIAMEIDVDTTFLAMPGPLMSSTSTNFSGSGLGTPTELINYSEELLLGTRGLSVVSTRTANTTVSFPSGTPIMTVGFVMEGNIAGGVLDPPYLNIQFQNIVLYNSAGALLPVWALADSIPLTPFIAPKDTSDTTGTGLPLLEKIPLNIYPQPAGSWLAIEIPTDKYALHDAQVGVQNVSGQWIELPTQIQGDKIVCDTKNLPGGNYLLTIETQHGILARMIQIESSNR